MSYFLLTLHLHSVLIVLLSSAGTSVLHSPLGSQANWGFSFNWNFWNRWLPQSLCQGKSDWRTMHRHNWLCTFTTKYSQPHFLQHQNASSEGSCLVTRVSELHFHASGKSSVSLMALLTVCSVHNWDLTGPPSFAGSVLVSSCHLCWLQLTDQGLLVSLSMRDILFHSESYSKRILEQPNFYNPWEIEFIG